MYLLVIEINKFFFRLLWLTRVNNFFGNMHVDQCCLYIVSFFLVIFMCVCVCGPQSVSFITFMKLSFGRGKTPSLPWSLKIIRTLTSLFLHWVTSHKSLLAEPIKFYGLISIQYHHHHHVVPPARYSWPSLATSPYRSSPLAGLQG